MVQKLLYSIGEVAEILGEEPSAVRYWSNYFAKYVKPERNAKGNRFYHPEDLEKLKQIHFLVKVQGMTLEGAASRLASDKAGGLDRTMRIVESLREIRAKLQEIHDTL